MWCSGRQDNSPSLLLQWNEHDLEVERCNSWKLHFWRMSHGNQDTLRVHMRTSWLLHAAWTTPSEPSGKKSKQRMLSDLTGFLSFPAAQAAHSSLYPVIKTYFLFVQRRKRPNLYNLLNPFEGLNGNNAQVVNLQSLSAKFAGFQRNDAKMSIVKIVNQWWAGRICKNVSYFPSFHGISNMKSIGAN